MARRVFHDGKFAEYTPQRGRCGFFSAHPSVAHNGSAGSTEQSFRCGGESPRAQRKRERQRASAINCDVCLLYIIPPAPCTNPPPFHSAGKSKMYHSREAGRFWGSSKRGDPAFSTSTPFVRGHCAGGRWIRRPRYRSHAQIAPHVLSLSIPFHLPRRRLETSSTALDGRREWSRRPRRRPIPRWTSRSPRPWFARTPADVISIAQGFRRERKNASSSITNLSVQLSHRTEVAVRQ